MSKLENRKAKPSLLKPIKFDHMEVDKFNRQHQYWFYKCECGNKKIIRRKDVKQHNTRSCGCLRKKASDINLAKGRTCNRGFQKGHKLNVGRKYKWREGSHNKGKIAIYETPNNPKSKKRFVTEDELTEIYLGVINDGFT